VDGTSARSTATSLESVNSKHGGNMSLSTTRMGVLLVATISLALIGCESDGGSGGSRSSRGGSSSADVGQLEDTATDAPTLCDSIADSGDGMCDSYANTAACDWDGGDCCEETCEDDTYICGEDPYDCIDPSVTGEVVTDPDIIEQDTAQPDGSAFECDQGVYEGNLDVWTPEHLQELAGKSKITGYLTISCDSCESLDALRCLTTIGGQFEIKGDALTSIQGLSGLTSIGADLAPTDYSYLSVKRCANLTDLRGLEQLNAMGGEGHVYVADNPKLTTLTGLEGLHAIPGSVDIHHNDSLEDLFGMDNVGAVGGYLRIRSNPSLTDVTAFHNVKSVGASLELFENPSLSNCAPIELRDAIGAENIGSYFPDGCCCGDGLCCPGLVEVGDYCGCD
jgi:hypothetical protein